MICPMTKLVCEGKLCTQISEPQKIDCEIWVKQQQAEGMKKLKPEGA